MDLRTSVGTVLVLGYGLWMAAVMENYYGNRAGYQTISWQGLAARQCETQVKQLEKGAFTRQVSLRTTDVMEQDERRFRIQGTLSRENYLGERQDLAYHCELALSYSLVDPFDSSAWLAKAIETETRPAKRDSLTASLR
ncbi:hypothetical protein PVT67_09460 [Gallaecimonas kandeliae]|uniref:hypothetical protein n=1 Tax=Gallaecimonas kandeliae TaxID=3029055 RepID=UPI00264773AC|nr:hypothetical protein [Gallaecimonas kandeliae]WKE63927.1 hypothetical protein PVT67_09460 [Gallaecimonas kandeliae]